MALHKLEPAVQHDPEELLIGVCGSCKTPVEVQRRDATKPPPSRGAGDDVGVWRDLLYVECQACKASSPKGMGPRVNLMVKGIST